MGRSGAAPPGKGRRVLVLLFVVVVCGFVFLELVRTLGGGGNELTVDEVDRAQKGKPRDVPKKVITKQPAKTKTAESNKTALATPPPSRAPKPVPSKSAAKGKGECDSSPENGYWRGDKCDRCQQYYQNTTGCKERCVAEKHCSGHGMCQASGWCLCHPGWGQQPGSTAECSVQVGEPRLGPSPLDPSLSRVDQIKAVAMETWLAYKRYAWGADEYQPLTRTGENWGNAPPIGVNIVDNLDTLIMFGFEDELADAREFIKNEFSMKKKTGVISVFETTIRVFGGFLSAYALTHDDLYKEKAEEVAQALLPAFQTLTGFPMPYLNPSEGKAWGGDVTNIAEIGTVQMELRYLSRITGNHTYNQIGTHIFEFIEQHAKPGMLPTHIRVNTGDFERMRYSMGGMCDSYYEYLLKTWILSGKKEPRMRAMYDAAIEDMENRFVKTVGNHTFIAETDDGGRLMHRMDHLSCFAGGMLALDSRNVPSKSRLDLAAKVTSSCHDSYVFTPTGLAGEATRYMEVGLAVDVSFYILRPETIESYMYMYRSTKDQKYRDWGYQHLKKIVEHCRVPGGYASLQTVMSVPPQHQNSMPSFWMSETLKYLWLLHSEEDVFSLDKFVFTTEAHPFPIENDTPAKIGLMMVAQPSANATALKL